MDIDQSNLDMVLQLCQKDLENFKVPAKITSTTDRRTALGDSDYVICTIRQGRLEASNLISIFL